jgi:hypothetical protein
MSSHGGPSLIDGQQKGEHLRDLFLQSGLPDRFAVNVVCLLENAYLLPGDRT